MILIKLKKGGIKREGRGNRLVGGEVVPEGEGSGVL